jgi:hypothetical protein
MSGDAIGLAHFPSCNNQGTLITVPGAQLDGGFPRHPPNSRRWRARANNSISGEHNSSLYAYRTLVFKNRLGLPNAGPNATPTAFQTKHSQQYFTPFLFYFAPPLLQPFRLVQRGRVQSAACVAAASEIKTK